MSWSDYVAGSTECVCLSKTLISFLSAKEISVHGRCVWLGGQSRGEQDVQLAETWKENTLPGSHAQSLQNNNTPTGRSPVTADIHITEVTGLESF